MISIAELSRVGRADTLMGWPMGDAADLLVLSPHLDDAAFSCGGYLWLQAQKGTHVVVLSPMAATDLPDPLPENAQRFLRLCNLGRDAGHIRRREDERACNLLGVRPAHGDLFEAIYRTNAAGQALYPTHESLFGPIQKEDLELLVRLEELFRAFEGVSRVLAPLGIGKHVDHRLVRQAAEKVFGDRLLYYEDFPYSNRWGATRPFVQPRRDWVAAVIPLNPAARRARIEAMLAYESQCNVVFRGRRALIWKTRLYLLRRGGERLWKHRVASSGSGFIA